MRGGIKNGTGINGSEIGVESEFYCSLSKIISNWIGFCVLCNPEKECKFEFRSEII